MTGVKQLIVLTCLLLMGASLVQGGEEIWLEQSDQQQLQQQQRRYTQSQSNVPTTAPSVGKPGGSTSVPTSIVGSHKPSVVASAGTQRPSVEGGSGATQKPSVVGGSQAPSKVKQPSSEPAPSVAPSDLGSSQPISTNTSSEQPTAADANATGTTENNNTVAPNNNGTSGDATGSSEPSSAPTLQKPTHSHSTSNGTVAPSQASSGKHPTKPTHKAPVSPTLHRTTKVPTSLPDDDYSTSGGSGHLPTDKPVKYVSKDDDPVKTEQTPVPAWVEEEQKETNQQLLRDKRLLISFGALLGFTFLVLVLTAQQLLENPHGCCASLCRLTVTCLGCLVRCICFPCRAMCGNRDRRTHDLMMSDRNSYTHDLELN